MVDPERLAKFLQNTSLTYKDRSNSYIFDCPRCCKKDKLYIRKKDGLFVCWKCKETTNFKGRPEYALSELLGLPLAQIAEQLYDNISDSPVVHMEFHFKDFYNPEDEDVWEEEIPIIQWPWNYYKIDAAESIKGAKYLLERGIPSDIAAQYGIRYCPQRRRVAFPVMNEGYLVGYQERLIIPNKNFIEETGQILETPKILSSEDIPREHLLMFLDKVTSDYAILCEGPIDAIKAHLCGGNVASMGKAVSKTQIRLLIEKGVKRIYLALDPDALDEVARLVREEFNDIECFLLLPPKGKKDLGEATMEEVYQAYLSAPKVHRAFLFAFLR